MNLQLEEIFEKIRKNNEKYKQFCKKEEKIDNDYQKNFPKDKTERERYVYNINYMKKLSLLKDEKEELDLEWEELHELLSRFGL